jgi:tRNA threonylcarbamoyladenosine biosynthesis protein TsaB
MSVVLGIDSSAGACSAAIWRRDALAARAFEEMERGHAERLLPMILATMAAAAVEFSALDAVAVTVGPGAFTGIRIGLAAARGLGLAAAKPVFGVTAFEAVAAAIPAPLRAASRVVVAIDTKRGDLFVQALKAELEPEGEGAVLSPAELARRLVDAPCFVAGDGIGLLAPFGAVVAGCRLDSEPRRPDAAIVARLASERLAAGWPGLPAEPLYLRAPDATPIERQGRPR